MDIRYIKAKELSARWGVTPRRINQLCTEGKLPGAYKEGKFWMIPDDVDRPDCLRENRNLYVREDSVVYNRKRPCPVGITSYKEVSNECYYVDKTLLIRDIIDNHSKVYLFTRPRRFGKTLTMDMVRTFFEKTDTDTSIYFKDKYISFVTNFKDSTSEIAKFKVIEDNINSQIQELLKPEDVATVAKSEIVTNMNELINHFNC